MSRRDHNEPRQVSRRSFLGGALAAALVTAAAGIGTAGIGSPKGSEREKPRLPVWIGHI
jgi:hypothetical protein